MSEYTHIYLHEQGRPILRYREYLSSEDELKGLSEEQIKASYADVDAYNETVRKSFGCALFYEEEIQSFNDRISELKSQIDTLEKRLLMADPKLYDIINRDIEDHKDYIAEEQACLASVEYIYNKFILLKNIIDNPDNSNYEILYWRSILMWSSGCAGGRA